MLTKAQKSKVKVAMLKIEQRSYDSTIIATFTVQEVTELIGADSLAIYEGQSGRPYIRATMKDGDYLPSIYCSKRLKINGDYQIIMVENTDGKRSMILCNKQGSATAPKKLDTL